MTSGDEGRRRRQKAIYLSLARNGANRLFLPLNQIGVGVEWNDFDFDYGDTGAGGQGWLHKSGVGVRPVYN